MMNRLSVVVTASLGLLGALTPAAPAQNAKPGIQPVKAPPAMKAQPKSAAPVVLPAPAAKSATLIPRELLFGNPERRGVQLSPDGKLISYLAPVNNVMNVFVGPSDKPDAAKAVTSDTTRGIRQYFWAYNNTNILYLQDLGGDENWKVFSVDVVKGGPAKDLTPFEDIKGPDGKPIMQPNGQPLRPAAQIEGTSEKFPGEILIGLNNRNPQFHDLYRCNISTGDLKLVYQNDEYAGLVTDDDFHVRFGMKFDDSGGNILTKAATAADGTITFQPFDTIPFEDALTTSPVGFDKTGNIAYFTDSRGRDTGVLKAHDLATGKDTILAEDPKADAGGILEHPTEKTIQAVSFTYDRQTWKVLDKAIQPDLDYLKTVADGDISVSSRTLDDKHWIVTYLMDNGPVRYYRYDRAGGSDGKAGKAAFLFTNNSKLEGQPLAKMHPVIIKSRDNLNLVSYLTLPKSSDTDGDGHPDKPLPLVLDVHGGPWARDSWSYNPEHQWLANRGYAVLSVNYRGSTGLGKNFINAGNKEWAGKMHDDLIDAVNWAVKEKIAQKDKVAIMGGSYGGYAALVGATFTPDTFACAISIVGPSNLVTLLKSIPPYWEPLKNQFSVRVGDFADEKFLESRSPLFKADRIKIPIMIGQGANDPRVKQSESDQIADAMKAHGIPVTYVVFPDEGHGFAKPTNNIAFNAIAENFLATVLGGRAEPVGATLAASTAQIVVGADLVGVAA
jgi:dipeptidyl aminopeptidase/acylaminoacyl peptidase